MILILGQSQLNDPSTVTSIFFLLIKAKNNGKTVIFLIKIKYFNISWAKQGMKWNKLYFSVFKFLALYGVKISVKTCIWHVKICKHCFPSLPQLYHVWLWDNKDLKLNSYLKWIKYSKTEVPSFCEDMKKAHKQDSRFILIFHYTSYEQHKWLRKIYFLCWFSQPYFPQVVYQRKYGNED